KYQFVFEQGLGEQIARDVLDYCRGKQDSELPLVQIICTQLHELARKRTPRGVAVIGEVDYRGIGKVKGGLRAHVEGLVIKLLPNRVDQDAFKRLFAKLYRRQSDGSVTTELIRTEKLEQQWSGGIAFKQMLALASQGNWRLLRVSRNPGDRGEVSYLSLG